MGGKRPDQYQIAPSEAGTTDYKRYPEATHGQDQDLDATRDKQRLAQSRQEAKGQPFPPDVPAPSAHANRGEHVTEKDRQEIEGDGSNTETRKENPLA